MFSFSDITKFDCNGSWRKDGRDFNPKGFFKSYNSELDSCCTNVNDGVILFGKKYEFWSALETDAERLFDMSRQSFLELRDCEIEIPKPYETNICKEDIAILSMTAQNLRSDISVFLYYIDYCLKMCFKNIESCHLSHMTLVRLKSELDAMKVFVHELDRYFLSEQFLLQCSPPNENLVSNAAYQLIHCCLDFRWFYILINHKFIDEKKLKHQNILTHSTYSDNDIYLSLMSELVFTSIVKYEFLENFCLTEDILICPCIKEMWVLLFNHLGLEAFWDKFNRVLFTILEFRQPESNEILQNLYRLSLNQFRLTDAVEFTIHFLKEIAILKEYILCKIDYPLNTDNLIPFYDNVKQYLKSNPSEKSLRVIIRVISTIMDNWDLEKENVIVLLWEHFYKKLHSTFEVSNSEYRSNKSKKYENNLLNEVKSRFLPPDSDEDETSFGQFLRIIAIHAQKSRLKGIPMKTLHSRIYIKFDNAKKFQHYSAVALYHISSLFLTTAIAFGVEKEVKKLRDLMVTLRFLELNQREKIIKWKTLVACLLLLAENGYNTVDVTNSIVADVQLAVSENNKALMSIFIECMQALIEDRHSYMPAPSIISAFTGEWIIRYINACEIHERGSILSLYDPLITDLREGAEWWSEDEMEDIKERLFTHVLPAVKSNAYPSIARTAALLLSFLIRSKNWAHTYSLYNVWMQTKGSLASATSEFIISFCEVEEHISKLCLFKRDYEIDIVKCFIRYHLLNEQTSTSHRLLELVKSLPTIARYASIVNYNWPEECGNLISFVRLFGACLKDSSSPGHYSSLKQLFNNFFAEFSDCCIVGLTPKSSRSVVNNIYHCCACLVGECYPIVYEDNKPSLFTTILDMVFLPVMKYGNFSELPMAYTEHFNEHLPLFIRGLLKLSKDGPIYFKNIMKKIINFNFPTSPELRETFYTAHPFYQCLLNTEINQEFCTILGNMFLTKLYQSDNHQGENCIRLFSFISCPSARDTIFSNCIRIILNAVIEMDYSSNMLKCALEYINKCVNGSLVCRNSLLTAMERFSETESSRCYENLEKFLGSKYPREMLGWISMIKQEKDDPRNEEDPMKVQAKCENIYS